MSDKMVALQRALGFQPEDLVANRAGNLSERQRVKIDKLILQYILGGIVFGIIVLIFLAKLVSDPFTGWPVFGICFGTILVVLVGAVWLQVSQLNADSVSGSVACVTAPVTRDIKRVRRTRPRSTVSTSHSRHYFIQVGEKRFQVMYHVFDAFEEGQVYEVFYLSKSNSIVSANWLGPAAPDAGSPQVT